MLKDINGNEYAEVDAKTVRETDDAVLFDDGDKKFWVPISCLEDWPEKGRSGTVLIVLWFAEREGLI